MCRPVKNRDGPIAGIPHTGGGGSRLSGADDNDPVSATQIPAPPNHILLSSTTPSINHHNFSFLFHRHKCFSQALFLLSNFHTRLQALLSRHL